MHQPFPLPPHILLLKNLEERLSSLRLLADNLKIEELPLDISKELFKRTSEIIFMVSDILTLEDEFNISQGSEKKELLHSITDALNLSRSLLSQLEKRLPIFWESITLFDEPLLEKINQIEITINQALMEESNNIDFEEITYIMQEISRSLEALNRLLEKNVNSPAS